VADLQRVLFYSHYLALTQWGRGRRVLMFSIQ
jgi:hypothetical protein